MPLQVINEREESLAFILADEGERALILANHFHL